MNIVILSMGASLYSTRRLVTAGTQRGHKMRVINPLHCYMNITSRQPSVHYRGKTVSDVDAVIPRIGASITFYGLAVVRQFEMMGVFSLNESVAIDRSRDKLRSLQLLARDGIGLPITGFAYWPDDTADLIKLVGGAPLVIKLLQGTQGIGVVLAETPIAAQSVVEAFRDLKAYLLVQEFIREAGGADVRCLVVGNRVVGAVIRQGRENEFRANLHRGGIATSVDITKEERSIALRAARVMGLNVAGVDMLRSKRGPLVIEVNSSPGLDGIEKATGKDIAGEIVKFIEKTAKPGKPRTRAKG